MLATAFGPNSIKHQQEIIDWEAAITAAVSLLEVDAKVTSNYLSRVLEATQKHGPYFVVAPGIAIAHAAPAEDVLETGMALLRLEQPVVSGSSNDPVKLLFAFCAVDSVSHIGLLSKFAEIMTLEGNLNILQTEPNLAVIRNLLTA